MKKIFFAVFCIALMASCHKSSILVVDTEKAPTFANMNDSLSWALGFSIAQNISTTGVDINREILIQALVTTLDSKQQPFTQQQTNNLLLDLERLSYMNRKANQNAQMAETKAKEDAYFAKLTQENPNVKKADKGYYYEVLKQGNGAVAEMGSIVVFDYKGSLINGHVFDQTYGNREPITHVVGDELMPGLIEAFCTMPAGSTYRFYFPCEMAFGARGTEDIPPFSTVIYEIELHEVRK